MTDTAKLPAGFKQPNGMIKIAVTFKPELFTKLCARAAERGETFSEVVNDCTACGLFDYEEAGE